MLKKYNKFHLLIWMLGISPMVTVAQREVATQNFANTTDGSPVSIQKYEDIKGSPYLIENWSNGVVKLKSGQTYKAKLKYDEVADELHFENKGQELAFVNPVSEFKIDVSNDGKKNERLFKKGFPSDPETFYQVLADGKAALLKRSKKVIVDKTPYNSATTVKLFESQDRYYLYIDEKMIPVKKNQKSLLSAFPEKWQDLKNYIEQEDLDFKNDEDLSKLVIHYNSL